MVILVKWKVFKTTKKAERARNNLMHFHNWSNAIRHLAKNLDANYQEQIANRLFQLEADEVYNIERRR
jgi:hypothetical protein